MLNPHRLYTRDGTYVCTAELPLAEPPPDALAWGERIYVRCSDGHYRQAQVWDVLRPVGVERPPAASVGGAPGRI